MKQQKTRELLVTTKVAQSWNEDFGQRVDELMNIVTKVDNEEQMQQASEILDVYNNRKHRLSKRRKKINPQEKPFEFLVFRN